MSAVRYRNNNTRLIRKQANRFSAGEVLYLFGCRYAGAWLRGPYTIREIRYQSDTGVSFSLRALFSDQVQRAFVEFGRTAELTRMAGPPLAYVIETFDETVGPHGKD